MVDEPVDHGCGDDVVGENLAPPPEWHVRGDADGALFVAGGDELEEQVRGVAVEGDVADLVDDEEFVTAKPFEFLLEAARGMSGVVATDPQAIEATLVKTPIIMDGRNTLDAESWRAAGWTYIGLGRP